ncbi:TonB-dependent receptor [Paludibaculum fermentans]|uniref:TonB-dependent receptor n=1 Tax=Paludibaculum fermentans TaxID=1473598 RepID=A0A7S7NV60_PALFE|nr:TonB-dependent receptor [Paludibaculum fermentans]QOY90387.1 TonB-dependent receptor [Paludibaculum fermentans]
MFLRSLAPSCLKLLLCLGAALAAAGQPANAQTGSIAGTVTEQSRGTALAGADVAIEGRSIKTTTDESGQYALLGIPAGKIKVTVTYLGLDSKTEEVTVAAGRTENLNVALGATMKSSMTVVGEPILEGQARALNDQKNSLNLVNVVAADQIGSFPDPNAAEATQRIPGIIVQRDQGEGRYVLIRGTEPRLSATTINGERIGTTENTTRQIPLDTIPADLMGAIEVTKVLTPDMEADSIGGRVNLVTKRAPAVPQVGLTIASGFNTLVGQDIKDYNGTYGQRLMHQKLGFIGSANFYQNNRGSQDLEPSYNNSALAGLDLRDYTLTRTRVGGTGDLDFRPNANSTLFVRGLRTEYEDSEQRHRYRQIVSSGRLERLLRDRYHDSTQLAISGGGNHVLPNGWFLSYRTAYSKANLDTPYRLEGTFRQTGVTFAPNVTATSIDPNNIQANPQNENLANFNFIQAAIQNDRGRERNASGGVDVMAPTRFGGFTGAVLKFGFKVRDADRSREVDTLTQTPAKGVTLKLTDYASGSYAPADNFLGGRYSGFGTLFPDKDKLRGLSHGGTLVDTIGATGDAGNYTAHERVTGAYAMEEIQIGERTTLVPGVRFELSDVAYGAPVYQLDSTGKVQSRTLASGNRTYLNVLPGLHLRHEVATDTVLRASFSRTLARPNYNDLAPFVLQDPSALTISRGNSDLKVTTSNNVDLSLEHYFKTVGVASAGFFYKNLGNYIYNTTLQQTIGGDIYRVSQPINGDTANLYGFETSLVRRLDFLPGALNGFGVYANYTYVHSSATLPRGNFVLPGQAKHMGNASLSYEKKGLSTRVSFNYQGQYLFAVGGTAKDDNWLDNRLEIDFSVSQRLTKHLRVFIDLLNLGNEPYRVYLGTDSNRPIQEERYKIWAIAGLKINF